MSIPVAILGPTGYTGLELLEVLLRHPGMHAAYLGSARDNPPRIDAEFPRLAGRLEAAGASPQCEKIDHAAIAARCRLAFLCLPHEAAMTHAPALLSRGVRVVDLSAAYRLRDEHVYQQAYGHAHHDLANLEHAVYGLTELARDRVRGAALVANPGCYPTAAALALVPLLRAGLIDGSSIIINAASGVSGAGRDPKPHLHYVESNENFSAYGIGVHRHQPEIEQSLRTFGVPGAGSASTVARDPRPAMPAPSVLFVPHLLPVSRGILETIYASPRPGAGVGGGVGGGAGVTTETLQSILRSAYAGERFVRVRDDAPALRDVQHTNQVHVNARVVHGRAVIVAAIDNLVKGASGQAVQNANLMLGREEHEGLS